MSIKGTGLSNTIGGSSETGSMEEGARAGADNGNGEPFVAAAAAGGASAGASVGGAKLPQVVQKSFGEVQGILEHNRVLIHEISKNQETRDADALTRNVSLIRELNTNIARVVDLYGDLSGSFTHAVAAKKAAAGTGAAAAAGGDKGTPKRPRSADAEQQQ